MSTPVDQSNSSSRTLFSQTPGSSSATTSKALAAFSFGNIQVSLKQEILQLLNDPKYPGPIPG